MASGFRTIINNWPSPRAMALEIGVGIAAAQKWYQRNRIPPEWWTAVVNSETGQAKGLTVEQLAALAADKRPAPSPHGEAA